MKIRNHVIILLITLCSLSTYAESVKPLLVDDYNKVYSLNTEWNFSIEDKEYNEMDNINYDDWFSISTASPWKYSIPELATHYGDAWYQISFILSPDVINEELGVYIPLSYGGYELYLNNNLIYNGYNKFGHKPIALKLSNSLINTGENSLLIKAGSFSSVGGFSGFVKIGNYKELQQNWIIYVIKNSAISFVSLFLALYFFIMYLYRKQERYNLYISGFSLSVALFTIGYYGLAYYLIDKAWGYWVITFVGGVNMYMFPILFIHSFYNLKLKLGAKIFIGLYLFMTSFILVEYLFTGQIFNFGKYLYNGFNFSYILVVFYLVFVSIRAIKLKFFYSKTMLVGILLLSVSFVYSMLCFMGILAKSPFIGEGFFLLVITFTVILGKRFAQTHTSLEKSYSVNLELNETLEHKVEDRTKELKVKNREVMQSIEYAALIQNSILPSKAQLDEIFFDHYLDWKPKDVVGGDFYWIMKKDNGFIAAVIDCTGHGVPGALLTMSAKSQLERIVQHINSDDPGVILSNLNRLLKQVLSQDNIYEIKDDGLDIGLCIYNSDTKSLQFSGSKIRLFTLLNGDIVEYKGDKQGVGYKRSKYDYVYTTQQIDIQRGMSFHFTTDGYIDQSGGEKEFSFGWKRYLAALKKATGKNMNSYLDTLQKDLADFQDGYSQRDDITLMGFKLKEDK
ncbi:MAG: SpoIIE family protein phosphatase [Spirochaetaceae bacterium]